jgi:hypothetical protein
MRLIAPPAMSRKAARAVQTVPGDLQWDFVMALGRANSLSDLSDKYKDWLLNGYKESKSDKVMATIEEALLLSPIEWIE